MNIEAYFAKGQFKIAILAKYTLHFSWSIYKGARTLYPNAVLLNALLHSVYIHFY